MPEQPQRSFFWTLAQRAGTQQRENQLSSTFAACFQQSRWFQRVIITALSQACRLDKSFAGTEWVCLEQSHLPKGGRDRIDLCLTPATLGPPSFHIESKVDSPLTEAQVRRYRKKGAEYLIALTKHPPEVSELRLRQLNAYALRWQDIHRALLTSKPTGPIDRFIRSTFTTFLKELNMAHAENLTLQDLHRLNKHLTKLRSSKYTSFVPKQSFQAADALLDFLAEVKRQFIEAHPLAEKYTYRWGPGVWLYFAEEKSPELAEYVFGWNLNRYGWRKQVIGCWVSLSVDGSATLFGVHWKRKSEDWSYDEWPLKQFCIRGVLSVERCVRQLTKVTKRKHLI
jgi:hypothetical protein